MTTVKIALALQNASIGATRHNIENCLYLTRSAAEQNADYILFPEMNLTGYLSGSGINSFSEPCPGTVTQTLIEAARQHDVTILAGMAEKDGAGRLFASHVAAMPDGSLFLYRKIHIAPPEKKTFFPGNRIDIVKTGLLNFGIQICYDAHFPELSTAMALKGADIIFIPHASPRGDSRQKFRSWMRHLTARAFDNGIFIAAVNQVGKNNKGLLFPGVAVLIGPDGTVVAEHRSEQESLFMVDLDTSLLDRVRNHRMRYFLPNRRDDLY